MGWGVDESEVSEFSPSRKRVRTWRKEKKREKKKEGSEGGGDSVIILFSREVSKGERGEKRRRGDRGGRAWCMYDRSSPFLFYY